VFVRVLIAVLSLVCLSAQRAPDPGGLLVYFGTYTGASSKGIYVSRLDADGALTPPALAAETANPSFLAVHPSHQYLYAVNEVSSFQGERTGSVSAFAIDRASGKLTLLNVQSSGGADPAHLTVDKTGRFVLVANYTGGSVTVLPIGGDGRLGDITMTVQHHGSSVHPERQKGPHAHAIALDPANRFAYDVDLGLDQVLIHRFEGRLLPRSEPVFASVARGSGPRHIAFTPDGRYAYVINELTCTITAFAANADTGGLTEVETVSTLPAGRTVAAGYSTAEIAVHPSGRFLFGSNRGHDTIAVFSIDATGRLTLVEHEPTQGSTPRGFGVTPDGRFLLAANQRSNSVVVMRIDEKTGALTPTGQKIEVGTPVSVEFVRR
jgi:6-phosphogluconolactonase